MATVDPPDVKWALKTVRRIDKTNERFVTRNHSHSGAFGFGPYQSYYIYDNRVLEGWADSCPSTETTPQLCLRGWHVHRLLAIINNADMYLGLADIRMLGHHLWLVQVAGPWRQDNRKATHRYIRFHTKLTERDIKELRGCTTRSQVRRVLGFGANEGVVW